MVKILVRSELAWRNITSPLHGTTPIVQPPRPSAALTAVPYRSLHGEPPSPSSASQGVAPLELTRALERLHGLAAILRFRRQGLEKYALKVASKIVLARGPG